MSCRVFYFTRTGNSKRVAERIAEKVECGISEITDDISWKGLLGWLRGGFYSLQGKETNISISETGDIGSYDKIVLVAPLWAGNTAPAGYTFIKKYREEIKKLHVVICNDGSKVEKAFLNLEEKVGMVECKYGVTKNLGNEETVIDTICTDLGKE
jgi:flavodoxin